MSVLGGCELFNFLPCSLVQFPIWRTVDDQCYTLRFQPQLLDKLCDPVGMQKNTWAEMRLNDALVEDDDFDLLVMGRTQGQGCYCFVNGLLQTQMQKLEGNYPYIVVDNEAGLEHISRGLLPPHTSKIVNQPPLNGEHFHFVTAVGTNTLIQYRRFVLFFTSARAAERRKGCAPWTEWSDASCLER